MVNDEGGLSSCLLQKADTRDCRLRVETVTRHGLDRNRTLPALDAQLLVKRHAAAEKKEPSAFGGPVVLIEAMFGVSASTPGSSKPLRGGVGSSSRVHSEAQIILLLSH